MKIFVPQGYNQSLYRLVHSTLPTFLQLIAWQPPWKPKYKSDHLEFHQYSPTLYCKISSSASFVIASILWLHGIKKATFKSKVAERESTIAGHFPPSSSVTGVKWVTAAAMTIRATRALPGQRKYSPDLISQLTERYFNQLTSLKLTMIFPFVSNC